MPRRSSVGSTTARPALPEPFMVEYAPTSRASCKRCQALLVQGKVKVGKKVQSPFHDGFDVHWVHDTCAGGYGLESLEELAHWQRLKWSDILRLAKVLDLDAPDAKNPEILRAATHITYRAEITDHLQAMGNAKILRQVLTENGIFFQDKWPAPKLAYIVADQILFGLLPPCPTCGNRSLVQEGEDVRCQGYFSASTRCDFKFRYREMLPRVRKTSACPKFAVPAGDVVTMEKLKRYRRLRIPAELQRHKAFASLEIPAECKKILGKLTGVEPSFQRPTAAADVLDSASEDEGDEVAKHMCFVFEGVDADEAKRLRKLIKDNGGHVMEAFDPARTTHVVISEEELYADPHGLAYDGALQHGLPIVMTEFIDALCDKTAADGEATVEAPVPAKGIRVKGRSSEAKNSRINGEYKRLDDDHNARPAFKHVGKSIYCFYAAKGGKWKLHEKLDDNSGHLGYCKDEGETPPKTGWWIFGGKEVKFKKDPQVEIEECEIVEAPTRRDAVDPARVKMRGAKLRQRKHLKLWKVDGGLGRKIVGGDMKAVEKKSVKRGPKRRLPPEEGSPALEVDEEVGGSVARDAQVYVDNSNNVYHVMCTKTDTSTNVNKFYKIQVLVHGSSRNRYAVFRKWGRVGGSDSKANDSMTVRCGSGKAAREEAIDMFLTKFTELTGTDWRERDSFEQRPGRYNMVEIMGTSSDSSKRRTTQAVAEEDDNAGVMCSLAPAVRSFVSLIFDEKVIEEHMSKVLHIDMAKMPLGTLSAAQLRRGLEVLSELSSLLRLDDATKRATHGFDLRVRDATNRFYTLIPHTISKTTAAAAKAKLNTLKKLEKAVEDVTDLLSIVDFTDARDRAASGQGHVLDRQFNALGVRLEVVPTESPTFKVINDCMLTTHAPTHDGYKLEIVSAFEVRRDEEWDKFEEFPVCSHNRRLLWHGSRLTNWVSILSKGLKIAPKEAPVTGYMFGKGLYFADCSSKSANYCFATPSSPYGVLVLCEVALGDQYKRVAAEYEAKKSSRRAKAHSTWGMGKTAPDPAKDVKLPSLKEVSVPMGPLIDASEEVEKEARLQGEAASLLYNEFIVYNTAQVRMKYIMHVKFNFNDTSGGYW